MPIEEYVSFVWKVCFFFFEISCEERRIYLFCVCVWSVCVYESSSIVEGTSNDLYICIRCLRRYYSKSSIYVVGLQALFVSVCKLY
jgi:hypothetical protein